MVQIFDVLTKLYSDYIKTTPKKIKLIDSYMFYILITGVIQFIYCLLVGTFPFNAFLSGFCSTVTSFVLAGNFFFIKSLKKFLIFKCFNFSF